MVWNCVGGNCWSGRCIGVVVVILCTILGVWVDL